MSLELALAANTEAMNALRAVIIESNTGRAAAIETLSAQAGPAAEAPRRGRPPKDKPAETPVVVAAAPPATPAAPAAPAVITDDDMRAAAGAYLNTQDPVVRAERKANVKAIIDHLGAATVVAILPQDRVKAVAWFVDFAAGKAVNFSEGEDEPAEAEDDMMG